MEVLLIYPCLQYKTSEKNSCLIALAYNLMVHIDAGQLRLKNATEFMCKHLPPSANHIPCTESVCGGTFGISWREVYTENHGKQDRITTYCMSLLAVGVLRITSSHRNVCV